MASVFARSRALLRGYSVFAQEGVGRHFNVSPYRFISTSVASLDSDEGRPAKGDKEAGNGTELVDPSKDSQLKDLFAVIVKKPLIPGGVPQYIRLSDQPLVKQLKELEQLGGSPAVAAFVRKARDPPGDDGAGGDDDEPNSMKGLSADDLEEVGTLAVLKGLSWTGPEGSEVAQIGVQGHRRVRRIAVLGKEPLKLQCRPVVDEPFNKEDPGIKATHAELVATMKQILELQPLYLEQLRHVRHGDFQEYTRFADLVVSLVNGTVEDNQEFLAEPSVPARMLRALAILKKEIDLINLQKDISRRVEEKFTKEQKKYFLMEQLKHIQKELGITKDEKGALVQKFLERFAPVKHAAPEEVRQAVEEEVGKLRVLEPASSEYNVTRNYLDWLTSMPYGVLDRETFDIPHAQRCLDAEHYGLQDVKDRILEFIAVGKLNDQVQGKILCMVGPPGVGKTSIGKSIAAALGRKFFRFSVGGLADVAEIKGHRRTYVGAMPGKVVQCLKQVHSSNPMVLIDEIDKLGRGFQGDPASALLELLDPEQNEAFRDHYLDVPLDLSKVLFVCTANVLDTIPRPLLDRMEVIQLSGYTTDEKRHIARKYLEKEARSECAIPDNAVRVTDAAMEVLIQQYCRESGVRNLKKQLDKIYRKLALELVTSDRITFVDKPVEEGKGPAPAAVKDGETSDGAKAAPDAPAGDTLETSDGAKAMPDAQAGDTLEGDAGAAAPAADAPSQGPASRKVPVFEGEAVVVDVDTLDKYLGKAPFDSDRFYAQTPAGVVMGLAWTSMGGCTLYVESNKVAKSGTAGLTITGQLGDVMKESMTIAQTFARRFVRDVDPANEFLEEGTVHLHVPQGATPKDGPSAGCTAVTALLSLAFNTPVIADVAMTGEISLSGRLLPIGGVKEKTLAAKRSGVTTVMFPEANRRDWDELGEELRAGLTPVFSHHYVDMFPVLFPSLAAEHKAALDTLRETVSAATGQRPPA